jgi:hypothetical protein
MEWVSRKKFSGVFDPRSGAPDSNSDDRRSSGYPGQRRRRSGEHFAKTCMMRPSTSQRGHNHLKTANFAVVRGVGVRCDVFDIICWIGKRRKYGVNEPKSQFTVTIVSMLPLIRSVLAERSKERRVFLRI